MNNILNKIADMIGRISQQPGFETEDKCTQTSKNKKKRKKNKKTKEEKHFEDQNLLRYFFF